ncbi:GDSL-type esterase/lipase family protein [Kitasatospora sp. NPDC089913]|uniref:GDSL-type esterase/lipase family protein n=1 Tax=Kitasatospora sp. NPDC089913 TaxID=3364080 RepID=UPI0037FBFD8C
MKITTARSVHRLAELALTELWMTNSQTCADCRPARPPGSPRSPARERPVPAGGDLRPPALVVRLCARLLMRRSSADRSPPAVDGRYGPDRPADPRPLTLLLLGDSLALGPGAVPPGGTLGARLARSLGEHLDRPVDLRVLARPGATTDALRHQLALASRLRPGIAVVAVGGADALLPLPVGRAARRFVLVLRRLRDTGWHPVVVPCPDPDPGPAPGLRAPARLLGAPRARRLARRQIRAAERTGTPVAPAAGPGSAGPAGHAEYAARMLPALRAAAGTLRAQGPGPGAVAAARRAGASEEVGAGADTAADAATVTDAVAATVTDAAPGPGGLRPRRPDRTATPPPPAPAATTAPPSRPAPVPASPAGPHPAPDATAPRA